MSVPGIDGRKPVWDAGWDSGERPPLGFWATTGWAVAAIAFGFGVSMALAVALAVLLPSTWLAPTVTARIEEMLHIVPFVSIVAATVWGAQRTGWSGQDYFAVKRPGGDHILLVFACLAVNWIVSEALGSALGLAEAENAQLLDDYRATLRTQSAPLQWLLALVVAPICEEMFFRGFLYRGWAGSRLGISGTILLTSVLFGLAHYQYGWYGQWQVGFFAVLAGWLRWRTDSVVPPMLLHAAIGGIAMTYLAMSA